MVPNGIHGPPFVNPSSPSNRLGPILYNDAGQRVDKKLHVNLESTFFGLLRRERLCPWYYLRGKCEGCDKKHFILPLNAKEFDCLWYTTRGGLCYKLLKGRVCEDPLCVYGHEKGCQIGSGRV